MSQINNSILGDIATWNYKKFYKVKDKKKSWCGYCWRLIMNNILQKKEIRTNPNIKTIQIVTLFLLLFLVSANADYLSKDPVIAPKEKISKHPPKDARKFRNKAKRLEWERSEAHRKLKAQGGTTEQHRAIDDKALSKARKLESKRVKALKKLEKLAKVGEIKQGSHGTDPSKGRGALGDVDTRSYSGKDFDKIRKAATESGYTVKSDGDNFYIEELDTTVHRESSKYKSNLGSSTGEAITAGGYGKETSRSIASGDKTTKVLDNLGKSGHTLDIPPNKMNGADWQEMGKMTGRNMDATGLKDKKFRKQLQGLKDGYYPDSLGIDDQEAFQKKCREMNNRATKKTRIEAKAKERGLEKKLEKTKKKLEKAKESGSSKKIKRAKNKAKHAQNELKKHRQIQKAAEDSLKKNQPKTAKKILDDTLPTEMEIDNKVKQQKLQRKLDKAKKDVQKAKKSGDTKKLKEAKSRVKRTKNKLKRIKRVQNNTKKTSSSQRKSGTKNIKSKAPKNVQSKKTYVITEERMIAGKKVVVGIMIFASAEDLRDAIKKGDTKAILDTATGGIITTTEHTFEMDAATREMIKKTRYANRTNREAYILDVGKQLRENGVSKEETEKIMKSMRLGKQILLNNKIDQLQKSGKSINIKPPKKEGLSIGTFGDWENSTKEVVKAFAIGLAEMPFKAKKFFIGSTDENATDEEKMGVVEEIWEMATGITEEGVYDQLVINTMKGIDKRVENANIIYDIALNKYRTYELNKEIEEQKERKDKYKLQKDLRENLIKHGYSTKEANEIARKAAHEGDWSKFRKARTHVHNITKIKEYGKELGIHDEDKKAFLDCMCRNQGDGTMGSHMNEKEECISCGPLSCWTVPMGINKTTGLKCLNQIVKKRYDADRVIFEEMHQLDEKTYKKMCQLIEESNSRVVKDKVKKIKELIKALDKDYVKKSFEAAQLYNSAKHFISSKDKRHIRSILTPRLRNIAVDRMIKTGDLKGSIDAIKVAQTIGGSEDILQSDLSKYEKWLEPWKQVINKSIPNIKKDIEKGQLTIASTSINDIVKKMSNGKYPPTNDPRWLNVNKLLNEKKIQISKFTSKTNKEIDDLLHQSNPKSALKLIDNFPKTWEDNSNQVQSRRAEIVNRILKASKEDKAGDATQKTTKALSHYKKSLQLQKDGDVQRKYDALKDRIKKANKLLNYGRELWKEGELQQAIAKVENAQKLAGKEKEINKTLKAMQKQKNRMDNALAKCDQLIEKKKFKQTEEALRKAGRISSKYLPYTEMMKKMDIAKKKFEKIRKLLASAKQKWQEKQAEQAIGELDAILVLQPKHSEAVKLKREWLKILQAEEKAKTEAEAAKKAALIENIRKIKEEAEKRARENAELIKKIEAIKKAAEERASQAAARAKQEEINNSSNQSHTDKKYIGIFQDNSYSEHKDLATLTGELTNASPIGRHVIHMPVDGTLNLKIAVGKNLSLSNNGGVKLYDSNEKTTIVNHKNYFVHKTRTDYHFYPFLRAGTYYLQLIKDDRNFYQGTYSVAVSMDTQKFSNDRESNDNFETATTFTLNQVINGHLGAIGQGKAVDKADYWKVLIPSDGALHIDVTTSKILNLRHRGISIYASDKKTKLYGNTHSLDSNQTHSLLKLKSGIYYIIIEKDDRNFYWGSYRFIATHVPLHSAESRTDQEKAQKEEEQKREAEAAKKAALIEKIRRIKKKAEERARAKALKEEAERAKEQKRAEAAKRQQEKIAQKARELAIEAEKRKQDKEKIDQRENASTAQFMGTLSGSWKASGAGGSFKMNIAANGRISGNYWGDGKGRLSGSVSSSGKLNMKSGGGAAGSGKWSGFIKIDSYGKLRGDGTWNVDGYKGIWQGHGE